ncbi:hypothetical protein Ccrd_017508 [Cynara cardunculus var. scolymus]|uniref:Peroxisome biogenesis protein 22 n=1 Tax=Cynara cardunculus var. scolymus TaxID=59895 RepID=A0A103Y7Y8_CYNCS|nr:hypothetical protein Ccrd_017508 [Cynara cardunculus var. scolymus]
MADYSKEDFIQFIKRIGAYLSAKVSKVLNTQKCFVTPEICLQDIRSVWAIAGLAVAVIFTWRLFRAPGAPRRRQPKHQAPAPSSSGVNSHSDVNLFHSGVSSSSEDSRAQTVIDEFFQPVKPTLGQIVRQRLSDGRKVTCRLLGVILEESTPEELQNQATVRSSVLDVLLEITKFCDLYLMETVLDDESEVLFCSTDIGRTSFVRQLEPDWHIDSSREITTQLARFIKYQLHISTLKTERIASNVFSSSSLEQFFSG